MSRKTVTSIIKNLNTARALSSRAVGLLLVIFILYGTTIEAAHRHGRTLNRVTTTSSTVQDPGQDKLLNNAQVGCNDCLICQLHQSFSTTLISIKSDINPSGLRYKLPSSTPVLIYSETTTTQTGRAPPENN